MLQRQVMQEMQRRQQIQELGDTRNQTYANQLSSGGQFQPTINGTPVHDSSQMFMLHNMQMMQQNGSNVVQGFPNGFALSQNQHHSLNPSLGFMQPQFSIPTQNKDKNLNQYPHFQGQSGVSGNLLTHRSNFSTDQNEVQDGPSQPSQSIQEKNFFRQVPVQSLSSGNFSETYTDHGLAPQRDFSHMESKERHDNTASLDPLEQKILFNTDDDSWGSFTKNCKMENDGLESRLDHTAYMDEFPSMQSGSWSALMQSAVAESPSSDKGIQEEWSGLSLQNSEPSTENLPSSFVDRDRPRNNWVDSQSPNMSMFPGFLQSGHQQKNCESSHSQSETFHASSQHSSRDVGQSNDSGSQQKHPTGTRQPIQSSLPSTRIWPGQEHANNNDKKPYICFSGDDGNEKTGSLGLHDNTSHQMTGSLRKQYDQANRLNIHNYSSASDKTAPNNVEHMSTFLGASSGFQGHNVTAESENVLDLFKRDVKSNDQTTPGVQLNLKVSTLDELPPIENQPLTNSSNNTPQSGSFSFHVRPADNQNPQSYPVFSSLSMENSNATFLSSRNVNDFIKNQGNMGTGSLSFSPAQSKAAVSSPHDFTVLDNTSPSQNLLRTVVPDGGGFSIGPPSPWSNMTTQQDIPLQKPHEISNIFLPNDSVTYSGVPNEPTNQNLFSNERNILESSTQSRQSEYYENLLKKGSSDHKGFNNMYDSALLRSTTLGKGGSLRHCSDLESDRQAEPECELNSPGFKDKTKVEAGKASPTAQLQNLQCASMYGQSDMQNKFIGSDGSSKATNHSQGSLQMAPSWFKQYGSLKEHHMLSSSNPEAALSAAQQFSGTAQGEFSERSSNMQENLANSCHVLSHTNVPPIASKLMVPSSDASNQIIVTSTPKKRKMVSFDTVPWYKEVNYDPSRLGIIGMAGLQWVHATNRIQEVKNKSETFEVAKFPAVRSKRRLIFATELMQQVFPPPPAAILRTDTDNDYIAHLTARLTLGDACSLTGQLPPDTNDLSTEKLQMSNRTGGIDFSKVVEAFIGRVKKIEHDLSRMDKSLSVVDIKMGTQDLEKFGIINRFAKFHSKAQQNTVDSAMAPKPYPKRYVIPHPMPRVVPEGIDCLSL